MIEHTDYQPLISKRALSWHRTTGIELAECISIAYLGFSAASAHYRPGTAAFTTYLWWKIDNEFKTYLNKNRSWAVIETTNKIDLIGKRNGHELALKETIESLSGRAQKVVTDILENPDAYLRKTEPYPVTRKLRAIRRIEAMGHTHNTAVRIADEIQTALRSIN